MGSDAATELYEIVQGKYLNYALSVITDRALPDVRDGLKPVQRRILYAMYHELHLYHTNKHRKCAAIVGEVLGKYHPHGDTAAYEALVRMAQDFNMRYPLVEGSGNFGSVDGDNAAAMRYTEARLTPLAEEMLNELKYQTVEYRPNYDGQHNEPIVLPARFPDLLCNGTMGIAVGMATSIPPHNLTEVIDACIALIDDRDMNIKGIMKSIKGPDFPTGATIINTKKEIEEIYTNGSGSITLRAEHKVEELQRGKAQIIITAIPYQVNRATLVEQIGQMIQDKKIPQLLDVVNESDYKTRVVLELKSSKDVDKVLNYLYKNTNLQNSFKVNLTTLVPRDDNPDVNMPIKANLKDFLTHFVDHRYEVLKRRFEFELSQLLKRIHILNGFQIVYNDLDRAIQIIRSSSGKEDCAKNLMKEFPLDRIQADAILETKLYNLSKLEVNKIKDELNEKQKLADGLQKILGNKLLLWDEVKDRLLYIKDKFGDKRRSKISSKLTAAIEFDADAYLEHENNDVVITKEGWIKRMKEVKAVGNLRVRDGDDILSVLRTNTKNDLFIFTNKGIYYTLRVYDLPYTSGFGEPIQKRLSFSDGEKIIAVMTSDMPNENNPGFKPFKFNRGEDKKAIPIVVVTQTGMGCRYSINREDTTNKKGKRFIKLVADDLVVGCFFISEDRIFMATNKGRGSDIPLKDVNVLSAAGKGIKMIKMESDDFVVASAISDGLSEISLINGNQKEVKVKFKEVRLTSRNNVPKKILQRGRLLSLKDRPVGSGFVFPKDTI